MFHSPNHLKLQRTQVSTYFAFALFQAEGAANLNVFFLNSECTTGTDSTNNSWDRRLLLQTYFLQM